MSLPTPGAPGSARRLLVKLTSGPEAAERANQALTVAATAAASGVAVGLWLTGEATWFAVRGRVPDLGLEHATSAAELVDAVLALGEVTVCTQCAARRGLTADDLLPGARIAGAATFVEAALEPGTTPLVY